MYNDRTYNIITKKYQRNVGEKKKEEINTAMDKIVGRRYV